MAPERGAEYVLHEGWSRLWQPGMSKKGFRLHLAYAGDGRYLLTTRRLLWYRWYPAGLKRVGYMRQIYPGTRVYSEDVIEIALPSLTAISRREWPDNNVNVPRINLNAGGREMAMLCIEDQKHQSLSERTCELFGLLRDHTAARDMTA